MTIMFSIIGYTSPTRGYGAPETQKNIPSPWAQTWISTTLKLTLGRNIF